MTETIIKVEDVSKDFKLKGQIIYALKEINLEIFQGEYLSIMGPSGSGKSTLFNMIGALDRPSNGKIQIGKVNLNTLSSSELSYFRCNYIGYVFQNFNLIPSLNALNNVALPMKFKGCSNEEAEEKAAKYLEKVGLGHRLYHKPDELSGGQQQRVAIARALANEPLIILADEPTGNLDLDTGEKIINILSELCKSEGVTIITATHDYKMLATSDRVVWIRDGKILRVEKRENLNIKAGKVGNE